jgi:hypothetical protein
MSELEFQNSVVLSVVQALLGAVGPEVVAVALATSMEHQAVDLFFLATEESEDLREVVEEIETDLDALLCGSVRISSRIEIGADWTDASWGGRPHRPVFARSA